MGDDMKKVYLIGYMGCGKSAIGKRLSFATKMPYYDMDTEIVKKDGYDDSANFRNVWRRIFS